MKPSSLYIAGPMAGIKDFNYPMFYGVEKILNTAGIKTINPAELDKQQVEPIEVEGLEVSSLQRASFLKRDFHHLTTCEGVVFLEGWESSTGANAELLVAQMAGMSTWLWVDGDLYPEPNLNADLDLIFAHLNTVVWGVADLDG
jgi:hypothetical protein